MTDTPSTAMVHAGFPSAGFWRRVAAWIYDLLVAVAIVMLATAIALGFAAVLTTIGWVTLNQGVDHAAWLNQSPWFSIYIVLVLALFFGWFWWRSGQTLGMRAWRLKVQQQNGLCLTKKQTIIRLLTCLLGLGNLWVLVDRKHRRAWHDYAAGSELVVLSKEANQLYYWREL
ncbi:MAG TPA: RDD family protein [Pseudidiomarina sp.]|nr:RDD family protein [Pseudidiomarina sp.]